MDEASYLQGFEDAQRATLSAIEGGMPCPQIATAIREDLEVLILRLTEELEEEV